MHNCSDEDFITFFTATNKIRRMEKPKQMRHKHKKKKACARPISEKRIVTQTKSIAIFALIIQHNNIEATKWHLFNTTKTLI